MAQSSLDYSLPTLGNIAYNKSEAKFKNRSDKHDQDRPTEKGPTYKQQGSFK